MTTTHCNALDVIRNVIERKLYSGMIQKPKETMQEADLGDGNSKYIYDV